MLKKTIFSILALFLLFLIRPQVYSAMYFDDTVWINWDFTVFSEPDFRSTQVAAFSPQYVRFLYVNDYGWATISTAYGEHWIYFRSNRMFLRFSTGLFQYISDSATIGYIEPQVVTIIQRYYDWILIETWLGSAWVYKNFMPCSQKLTAELARFGNSLSVYFENIDSGFIFRQNAERLYFGASVSKAFFAMYIYKQAELGKIDLNDTLTFSALDQNWGSGLIQRYYPIGSEFTIRELLRLNLSYSDNVATLMLVRHFGIEGYRQFISQLGANPHHVNSRIMDSNLTSNDAGILMRAIYDYINSDAKYSDEFKNHLLNNQFPFIVSDYPVASKTGWTSPIAWHDAAIVYAPSPYILVILSSRAGWSEQDYKDFKEISKTFQHFNSQWFVY